MTATIPLAPPLDHAWIAAHIPHGGAMCVLDTVDAGMPPASAAPRRATVIRTTAARARTACLRLRDRIRGAGDGRARRAARCARAPARRLSGERAQRRRIRRPARHVRAAARRRGGTRERRHRSVLYGFALRCGDRVLLSGRAGDARRVGSRRCESSMKPLTQEKETSVKVRQFIGTALVLALISPIAHADMSEVKQDIKRDSKEAAHKTGEAARSGHATASAAKAVGHGSHTRRAKAGMPPSARRSGSSTRTTRASRVERAKRTIDQGHRAHRRRQARDACRQS